jgi:hypothetical protein
MTEKSHLQVAPAEMASSWRRENEDDAGVASVASGEIGFDGEGRLAWFGVWVERRLWMCGRCRFMEKKALRSAFWIK